MQLAYASLVPGLHVSVDQVARFAIVGGLVVLAGCGEATTDSEPTAAPPVVQATVDPDAPVTVAELRRQLKANQNAEFRKVGGEIVEASLAGSGVRDITPLKGLNLRGLNLQRLVITDLSPLAGMPLATLELMGVPVTDLSPLKGMPLELLGLEETEVSDLTPLAGAPLTQLYLNSTSVEDISSLAGMPITQLNLVDTKVTDLTAVEAMPLNTLWLQDTPVKDLSPVAKTRLVSLDVAGAAVSDLTPLQSHSSLERLNIIDSKVTDLSPLENVGLRRLLFTPQNITAGLDVLREMPGLVVGFEKLDVNSTIPVSQFFARYDAGEFRDNPSDKGSEDSEGEDGTDDDAPSPDDFGDAPKAADETDAGANDEIESP